MSPTNNDPNESEFTDEQWLYFDFDHAVNGTPHAKALSRAGKVTEIKNPEASQEKQPVQEK